MATCSTSLLISQACDNNFLSAVSDIQVYRALKHQLLCNIQVGGGGGGGNVEKFESANIPLDGVSTAYPVALVGLSGVPRMVHIVLVCIGIDGGTASAVGQELLLGGWFSAANLAPAFGVRVTAASVTVELGDVPLVGNESNYVFSNGGGVSNPTSFNNFALKVYAWY